MSKNDGGPAFPFVPNEQRQLQDGTWDQNGETGEPGMSLRDWFAGQAIHLSWEKWMKDGPEVLAEEAYKIADAMLKEREK